MSEGRGRSRGTARGQDNRKDQQRGPGGQSRGPGDRPPSQSAPQSGPQGPWGRRPGARPQQPQPGPSTQVPSRAIYHTAGGERPPGHARDTGPEKMDVSHSGGGDVASLGRGSMRGRRVVQMEIIDTKPSNLVTKLGTTGTRIMLQSNYFKLLTTTDWSLYQYRVDFEPEEDRTIVRKGMLRAHKDMLGTYIFDGTMLFSSNRYKNDKLEFVSSRQSDDTKVKITVRLVGQLLKGDYHYLQFFNIIMRKCLGLLNLQLVGRDYYDARSKLEIREHRLELWPGYLTSIRQHEHNILMCSEITHKIMRQETLLDILNECYEAQSRSREPIERAFKSRVVGQTVLTDYNNNTYRIDDVHFNVTPNSTFQLRDGQAISYKDYYKNKYQIRISNPTQPMLLSKKKSKDRRADEPDFVYLVPELCRATGLTDSMRNDFRVMKALADHTRIGPQNRIEKLLTFNKRLRSEDKIVHELNEWNMKLENKLVDLPGRILQPEGIVFGNNVVVSAGQFADWTQELHSKALYIPVKLRNWVVIHVNRLKNDVMSFIGSVISSANAMGCAIDQPRYVDLRDDHSGTYVSVIEQIMSKSNPELLYCVVSNNRVERYTAIKKKCLLDRPVASQVMLQRNLTSRNSRTIATKIAIQLACKLGGAPWSIQLPNIHLMVIGFDVCHNINDRNRDFGAIVATLDRSLTRYFSAVSEHTNGEELSNELSVNVVKALQTYKSINKTLPTHILVYRDGVGEGQIPYVYQHEVAQLKKKLKDVYGETPIKMAFIIVTKRLNTRFFFRSNNPPPGTVVDDVITDPLKYDFFVVSQNVRQGTVTPTAYSVIEDSIGWSADQIQRMTYKLTHMYYNTTCTARVPAPCHYAHRLAQLVGKYVCRPPSTQLETFLYFL